MEKIVLLFFLILAITSPFLYRLVRLGNFSWFVKKDKLDIDQNYKNAEQFRFIQILLGFFCLVFHGSIIWGWANILLYVFIASGIGFLIEIIGSRTGLIFGGTYEFEASKFQGPIYLGIPISIPLSWAGLIYMSLNYGMLVTGYDFFEEPMLLFLYSSFLLTAFDVVLDPIGVDEGRWKWDKPGFFYSVPLLNFIGWFFTIFIILWSFKFLSFKLLSKNGTSLIFQYSPSFLFIILPAIASRPCFERGLRVPGFMGLLLTFVMLSYGVLRYFF